MVPKICSIPECEKRVAGRGWCHMHYRRWRLHGDPLYKRTALDRLLAQTRREGACWLWTGYTMQGGYAAFYNGSAHQLVHRFSYEAHKGSIPEGMQVDHTCHERLCVNPEHLRVVTPKQNCENLSGPTSRSTSGIRGVYWSHHAKKWYVRVGHNGNIHHGGYFTDKGEAEAAAITLRNQLFTHNNLDRIVSK